MLLSTLLALATLVGLFLLGKNMDMELLPNAKRFAFKITFIILYSAILIWFATFFYLIIYYLYIPAIAHIRPIHLQYDIACLEKNCKFPSANVTLAAPGYQKMLTGGQSYAIEVALEMPESEPNKRHGMFMIKLAMLSEKGEVLQTSHRPAVLHYRSPLFRFIYTIFFSPALIAGSVEEMQKLVVPLFESYVEESYRPAYFAYVEIQARVAEVYSSTLQIHAQFTGLRYFMYYWPLLSAFVGIGSTFFSLCIITLIIWMRYVMINGDTTDLSTRSRIRPSRTKSPVRKASYNTTEQDNEKFAFMHDNGLENSRASQFENGIEILPTEQQNDSQQFETESELVSSLRRRVT